MRRKQIHGDFEEEGGNGGGEVTGKEEEEGTGSMGIGIRPAEMGR